LIQNFPPISDRTAAILVLPVLLLRCSPRRVLRHCRLSDHRHAAGTPNPNFTALI
jgi:hypothetical protein